MFSRGIERQVAWNGLMSMHSDSEGSFMVESTAENKGTK